MKKFSAVKDNLISNSLRKIQTKTKNNYKKNSFKGIN